MNQITLDQNIQDLINIFGKNAKIELFNDVPNRGIYAINTDYSIGRTILKTLKSIKAKLVFIDWTNEGLRLLVEVKN